MTGERKFDDIWPLTGKFPAVNNSCHSLPKEGLMFNLLTEPLIRYRHSDGEMREASLPEVYAALMADEVEAFSALRPHQRHAWHAFLVQLGVMGMHRAGLNTPPIDAEEWRRIISALTQGWPDDEPWQLVVDDITKPAFMQPPSSSADKLAEYKSKIATPDELDPLVTSRNHDLKSSVAMQYSIDDWMFALITQQTMGGYSIAGSNAQYHTVSRVNGGSGSRVAFSLTPSARLGRHIKRDILALQERRAALVEKYDYVFADSGIELVWIEKWDGECAINLDELNPFYIEICRRIRLFYHQDPQYIYGKKVGSKLARINAKELSGRVGDPWMPISIGGKSEGALRLTKKDRFGYRQISGCLNPSNYELPPIFLTESEQKYPSEMLLVARGIVSYPKRSGSGTETWGYDERVIPLRLSTLQIFGRPGGTKMLGEISKNRIYNVRKVQDILCHAVATFAAKGDGNRKNHGKGNPKPNDVAQLWINRLDDLVDVRFFDDLQTEFKEENLEKRNGIRQEWLISFVIPSAETVLTASWEFLPCPDSDRVRATATSKNVFDGRIYQEFSDFLNLSKGE